jgi:hypothetical protein
MESSEAEAHANVAPSALGAAEVDDDTNHYKHDVL